MEVDKKKAGAIWAGSRNKIVFGGKLIIITIYEYNFF